MTQHERMQPALSVDGVSKHFPMQRGVMAALRDWVTPAEPRLVRALDEVSLEVPRGRTVGIVGESGCGKSTLARILAGLSTPSAGTVRVNGRPFADYLRTPADALKLQMIFQDPQSSLNPRMKVIDIIGEAPVVHGLVAASERRAYVAKLLAQVGLSQEFIDRYPHQFSGGQRQRIGIARALAVKPEVLICDESVAALDVSVQAQIINLLMDIRRDIGLTMLFISHDLSVVRHICEEVVVMYLGRVVETGATEQIFHSPRHPYTRMLLEGMPKITTERRDFLAIEGEIPSPLNPPSGCHFHPRCAFRTAECDRQRPPLERLPDDRRVACLNWRTIPDA
ncbi:ABC transporter ATP-binding protein [Cereibacter changlensis]|nr:oligopeptide/dipeptide ABC transporter ATP-binding protein [Cereibacter changlensis]